MQCNSSNTKSWRPYKVIYSNSQSSHKAQILVGNFLGNSRNKSSKWEISPTWILKIVKFPPKLSKTRIFPKLTTWKRTRWTFYFLQNKVQHSPCIVLVFFVLIFYFIRYAHFSPVPKVENITPQQYIWIFLKHPKSV